MTGVQTCALPICKAHIDAIVTFGMKTVCTVRPLPGSNDSNYCHASSIGADRIGQALWDENHRSVHHRYQEESSAPDYRYQQRLSTEVDVEFQGQRRKRQRELTAMDIIKMCGSLEYQSCEHPEWEPSWAHEYLDRVVKAAIHKLPGYEQAIRDL